MRLVGMEGVGRGGGEGCAYGRTWGLGVRIAGYV